ncbi:hypothetical protein EXS74_03125 [Candidatus Woesearchaeota archaeon]|nr:hypothetical protein [Candidatus Woesearchaeota archaeon]
MVAMIFMVVLVVALAFYFKFSLQNTEEVGNTACLISNTVLLSSIASMPEIQCSLNGVREQCIDTTKLLVFDASREYSDFFTSNCKQKVYFTELYPVPEDIEEVCTQGTYPECALYTYYDPNVTYSASILISTPVSLYYPLTDEYHFGKLVVEVLQ